VHYSELLSQCCDYLRHSGYTDEEAFYCYNLDIVEQIVSKVQKILEDESKKEVKEKDEDVIFEIV
jgi:hypothetical protein